jgi:CheY-like chemotaxis protein
MLEPILLVEDNPKDLELTLLALEKCHLANEVVTVRDGAEALDYLFRRGDFAARPPGNPALILLDVKLPKVDGIEVLEKIQADETLRAIPVVMLTTSSEEQDMLRSDKFGANAYVVKPVMFQDFIEAIRALGAFWAVLNAPPPGSLKFRRQGRPGAADRESS